MTVIGSPLLIVVPAGIASWLHTREPGKETAVLSVVESHRRAEAKQGDYLVGTDETMLVVIVPYASGTMQSARSKNAVGTSATWGCYFLQLAEGRADLYTEMPVKVTGFKQPID